jgi:tRNA-dihydrouridine synthase
VWNRSRFEAVKRVVSVPVLAVGGIRTRAEVDDILEGGAADLVGFGRPFYAEPDLPRRILAGPGAHDPGLCVSSNLCVPAQMLGMKGVCYNPEVVRLRGRRPGGVGTLDGTWHPTPGRRSTSGSATPPS